MSMEKDFRLLCKTAKREIVAFKHPIAKEYVLIEADRLTDAMDDKIAVKNQIEAKRILKENYGELVTISKSKLNKLMK